MKKRKIAIICSAIAMVCWGILFYAGIYEKNTTRAVIYGLAFVCSMVTMIKHIIASKREKHDYSDEK